MRLLRVLALLGGFALALWPHRSAATAAGRSGAPATIGPPPEPIALPPNPETPTPETDHGGLSRIPLVPAVAVFLSLMLLAQAAATIASRDGHSWADMAYWPSLIGMVLVVAIIQVFAKPTPAQRLGLVVALSLALYGVKLLANPTGFTYYDELSHARTAADIIQSGHLLHQNPLLPISPYFPGMEILADATSRLTGASLFASGLLAIGLSRVVLVAGLYALFQMASDSPRIAGIATVVYMANPSFLYFDAGFSYESFALPLAIAALVLTLRWMQTPTGRQSWSLAACLGLIVMGLAATHHLTSYLFTAMVFALCAFALILRRWDVRSRAPWPIAFFALAAVVLWATAVATPTIEYLKPILTPAVEGVVKVATGREGAYRAFSAAPTPESVAPLWLKITAFTSIALILASLPFGLKLVWQRRSNPAALLLGGAALVYVPALVLRVAGAGVESANRSSGFVFLGIGFVVALLVVHVLENRSLPAIGWRRMRLSLQLHRDSARERALLGIGVTAVMTIIFVGGVTIFWPPYARLPGPYLAGTDLRAVSQQGISSARWMRRYLGVENHILTDRTNGQLAGAYGEQDPVDGEVNGLSIALPFTTSHLSPKEIRVLRGKGVDYLLVDKRLSNSIPVRGWYFSSSELYAKPYLEPIPLSKLTKFGHIRGINLIYDNGSVQVYDVRELTRR